MGVLYRPVSAIAVVLTTLYLAMPGKKKAPRVQSDHDATSPKLQNPPIPPFEGDES